MAARRRPARRRPARGLPPYGWYPPPSRPLPAEGIRARTKRGDIGGTWWSRRFIDILESFQMGARLTRGRRYARAGQVLDLAVEPGAVAARVQGSRAKPYRVRIRALTLPQKDWARVEKAMASKAVFLAKLLAGEMPRDIEQAFAEARLSLFPATARDLVTDCSCPDWANPCKHIAATYYLLAEAFDEDPFLIFRWRGRDREDLLARLGTHPSEAGSGEDRSEEWWDVAARDLLPLAECIDGFWAAGEAIDASPARPRAAAVPEGILRGLGPTAVEVRGQTLADVLAPAYAAITAAAERRALRQEPT